MSEQLFDVVFFGILQADKAKKAVVQNMAALFKTDSKKLAPYFAGGRKVIKGKINKAAAEKYRVALENVGLVIKIEPCESAQDTAPDANQQKTETPPQPSTSPDTTATDSITVAPVGANVIENPVEIPAQKIADISNITMAEAGADVLENPATAIAAQDIDDISNITMAEVGSDVLDHPTEVIAQEINELSDISLAEVGADIIKNPKPMETAAIADISELSLNDKIE